MTAHVRSVCDEGSAIIAAQRTAAVDRTSPAPENAKKGTTCLIRRFPPVSPQTHRRLSSKETGVIANTTPTFDQLADRVIRPTRIARHTTVRLVQMTETPL